MFPTRGASDGDAVSCVRDVAYCEGEEMNEVVVDRPFDCPYCGVTVRSGDFHAKTIEKKGIKDGATIIVTCILRRTFLAKLDEVKE